jgi:hypothetical protein
VRVPELTRSRLALTETSPSGFQRHQILIQLRNRSVDLARITAGNNGRLKLVHVLRAPARIVPILFSI